jgi:flavin-dependent dehydrogenase
MSETIEADVTIVGAGTSGAYLAWKLADAGFDCLVLESEELKGLGTHIGPFHRRPLSRSSESPDPKATSSFTYSAR